MQHQRAHSEEHTSFTLPGERGGALLIHGFMGTPEEMRPLANALSARGYQTVAPLLPGFGRELNRINDVGHDDWIGAASREWDSLHSAGRANLLIGHSMGGAIAMEIAARRPPDKLILLAPLWRMMGGNWSVALLPVLKHVFRRAQPFAQIDFSDPKVRGLFELAVPGIDLDDRTVQESLRNDASISTATLDELRRVARAAGKQAGRITADTLVIQGTVDYTVRARDTRSLASRLGPNTRLMEVETGHLVLDPDSATWPLVRDSILDFVDDPESA